ncbi:YIP1 family protein [Deltaproteobacteria bacterium]|nr:YIP1 family protein [Deltaproteobacteria bacterium]
MTLEIICPNCNFSKKVPKEKIPTRVKWANCPRCKESFEFAPSNLDPCFQEEELTTAKKEENGPSNSPWERRFDFGLWQGVYKTFKYVLFSPQKFFTGMTNTGEIREPLAFGLLLGSMGTMFGLFWQFIIFSGLIHSFSMAMPNQYAINLIFLGIIIISPLFVILRMFISGGIIHACLFVMRGERNGFEGTFRVVAFSQSTQVLGFIPFVGVVTGWVWHLIVLIIGLRSIHGTSYLKTIIAVLVTLFITGLILLPVFLIKSFISGSMTFVG